MAPLNAAVATGGAAGRARRVGQESSAVIDPRRHDAVLFDLAAVTDVGSEPLAGGLRVFDSTVLLGRQLQQAGLRTAVFSLFRDRMTVLDAMGLGDLFSVRIDGVIADELGPAAKPELTMLVEAVNQLAVRPGRCVVVESSGAGVAAGRSGGFALVIGVDRTGEHIEHSESVAWYGADLVVPDLSVITVRTGDRPMSSLPDARAALGTAGGLVVDRRPAVFFDFDGTLSDIVDNPDAAVLVSGAAEALQTLSTRCPVAVLSGRDLADVQQRIGLPGIWYAGSHGFELVGPDGSHHQNEAAMAAVPVLSEAAAALDAQLGAIPGVVVEHKRFAVAVHYRNTARDQVAEVIAAVRTIGKQHGLRVTTGREVIELRPEIDWDKGKTLRWVISRLIDRGEVDSVLPLYLGDDITDEDAFDAVRDDGVGIVVRHTDDGDRATSARFALDSPADVVGFIEQLAEHIDGHH